MRSFPPYRPYIHIHVCVCVCDIYVMRMHAMRLQVDAPCHPLDAYNSTIALEHVAEFLSQRIAWIDANVDGLRPEEA